MEVEQPAEEPNHDAEPRKEDAEEEPKEEAKTEPQAGTKNEPGVATKQKEIDTFKIPEQGSDGRKRMVLMIVNRWSILWKLLRRRSWRHRPPRGLEMGEGLYLTPGLFYFCASLFCSCF